MMLQAQNIAKAYGEFRALDGVTLEIHAGEFVSVIGLRSAHERIALAYTVFPDLRRYERRKGTQLSGGERKCCPLPVLRLDPECLLVDEPLKGCHLLLSPPFVRPCTPSRKLTVHPPGRIQYPPRP
jgi:ABC-type branched-subunit amino acid transport system ATPase component